MARGGIWMVCWLWPAWKPGGLQLEFAAVDPEEIRRGVRELAMALEEAR
jgi:hypothetical protein